MSISNRSKFNRMSVVELLDILVINVELEMSACLG